MNKQAEREAFFDLYKKAKEEGQAFWQTDYYREHYWEEKKKQYEKRMNEYLKNRQRQIKKEFYTSTEPFKKGQEEHIKESYKKALKELAETLQSELPTL